MTSRSPISAQRLISAAEKNVVGLALPLKRNTSITILFHTQMLETIDNLLIPNARNEQLKNSLVKVARLFFCTSARRTYARVSPEGVARCALSELPDPGTKQLELIQQATA
jgi:hypothetical protein